MFLCRRLFLSQKRQRMLRSGLFSFFFIFSYPYARHPVADRYFNSKCSVVVRPFFLHDRVMRKRPTVCLGIFKQCAFVIFIGFMEYSFLQNAGQLAFDEPSCFFQSAIEIHCAYNGFVRICENRIGPFFCCLRGAVAEKKKVAQMNFFRIMTPTPFDPPAALSLLSGRLLPPRDTSSIVARQRPYSILNRRETQAVHSNEFPALRRTADTTDGTPPGGKGSFRMRYCNTLSNRLKSILEYNSAR